MEALGRLVDVVPGFVPVDMQTGANTGKRVHLRNYQACMIIVFKAAGTSGDNPVLTLQQHTAASGGTSSNLSIISHYYLKSAATLTGAELWTRINQSIAATISDPGGATTSGASQQIVSVPVDGAQLSDGYEWISLSIADTGTNAQLGCVLYILHGLEAQRKPENIVNPQA